MIKFSTGETVETVSIFARQEYLAGFKRDVATITIVGIDYDEANRLFVDGAIWSIVEGKNTYDQWNAYTKAGSITDNRDGTLVIKMGFKDTAEQVALNDAQAATARASMIAGRSVSSDTDAENVRAQVEALFQSADIDDDSKIRNDNLCAEWELGAYKIGDVRTHGGQVWECYQDCDTEKNPDIIPDNTSWFTFWRPLHGKTPETARPFVPVQGSHDMYRTGEYMIYTDGKMYKCKSDTNFSPDDYAQAWEVVES